MKAPFGETCRLGLFPPRWIRPPEPAGLLLVEAIASAIEAHGGRVAMQLFVIEGVGTLIIFEEPEGNIAGVPQYLEGVLG